jgi:integrase
MARKKSSRPSVHITNTFIEKLPVPASSGQAIHYDDELTGFAVRVTAGGSKSFIVDTRKGTKSIRYTIGKCSLYAAAEARKRARTVLGNIQEGRNPHDERREEKARSVALGEAFEEFLKSRKKNLAPRTMYDYKRLLNTYLADWKDRPLIAISKDMVEKRHAQLGEASGEAQANYTMRFLRSVFNFAIVKYEDSKGRPLIAENPVKRLSQLRAWYVVDERTSYIKPHQLKHWFAAALSLSSNAPNALAETVRDYLIFLVLTGLRRNEAAKLRWDQVDLQGRFFTVLDTKNKQPHTLPLSDYLYDMLAARSQHATKSEYVFPGPGKGGYLVEPKKQVTKVIEQSGVTFILHDLRRTFATAVNKLEDRLTYYSIKRLLNHKVKDVTGGYIQIDVESLRQPMQQVTDYILKAAGIKESADVIEIQAGKQAG